MHTTHAASAGVAWRDSFDLAYLWGTRPPEAGRARGCRLSQLSRVLELTGPILLPRAYRRFFTIALGLASG